MGIRLLAISLVAACAAATPALGAQRAAKVTKQPTVPAAAKTVKGQMRGHVIAVRTVADKPIFDYEITGARLVDGKLELTGTVRPTGKPGRGGEAGATLVGTLGKEPPAEYHAARARRNARRAGLTPPPASGAPAEQKPGGPPTSTETAGDLGQLSQSTQSTARTTPEVVPPGGEKPKEEKPAKQDAKALLAGAAGCEVIFLKMEIPAPYATAAGGKTVQLNVALAPIDNTAGVDLNHRICLVAYAIDANDGTAGNEVAELNRSLGAPEARK